jgi:predicted PurR-regulated permease PerM
VADWPLVGEQVYAAWSLGSSNLDDAIDRYGPSVLPTGGAILARMAAISADLLKILLSVALMGFMLKPGPRLAAGARAFAGRLVAPRGAHFVDLAGATIRNVSRGVIGVALLQTLLAGIVLEAAGVPGAGLFAFVILIFCIIQIGPAPVLVPVVIWAWATMSGGAALVLTLVLVPVLLIDNIPEADPHGARPDHAPSGYPGRRHRRDHLLWAGRALPRTDRARGLLRTCRRLGADAPAAPE